jgi:hypothetical protein
MLFDIDKEGNLFSQDPRVVAVPEFNELYKAKGFGAKYIRYIVFVYDYDSPYSRRPFELRKTEVCNMLFGTKTHGELDTDIVKKAIKVYNQLQYDPLNEQVNLMMDEVEKFNTLFRTTDISKLEEMDDKKKYLELVIKTQDLHEAALVMRDKLNADKKKREIRMRGGGAKSFIESQLSKIINEEA